MLSFLPSPLVALIGLLLHVLNIIICGAYIFVLAPFRLLIPLKPVQFVVRHLYRLTPYFWSSINRLVFWLCTRIEWDIQLPKNMLKNQSYILICNHQSWNDILINQKIFYRLLPSVVYFMKRELLWVPILGWACWLIDFPLMRRYSKSYLAKYPNKRGKDIQETKKTCERFFDCPATFVNYPEGTRFTQQKHKQQHSPFKHLLNPRAGGIALALQAMQGQIKHIVNVTIVYQDGVKGFWQFLGGAAKKISVRAELIPVTKNLIGDYINDEKFRVTFQQWLNQIWASKDELMASLSR
jgi:1-acyl-sn-glycerol-3-phosphate acyltransferase